MAVLLAVGLGANLGGREASLLAAASALERVPGLEPLCLSSGYETDPVGTEGPPFLNAALLLRTGLSPLEVLAALQGVEAALGRRRGVRWGPRAIDLDLLVVDGVAARHGRRLVLPHPRLRGRAFALAPLVEIWPGARDPARGDLYAEVLERVGRQGVSAPFPLPRRVPRRPIRHTADLAFEVRAPSLEALLERAALALVDLMVARRRVTERARRVVEARGEEPGELLVGLLSELVYLLDGEGFVPRRTSLLGLEPGRARLAVYGAPLADARQIRTAVKAVTHHLGIEAGPRGGLQARVVLDV